MVQSTASHEGLPLSKLSFSDCSGNKLLSQGSLPLTSRGIHRMSYLTLPPELPPPILHQLSRQDQVLLQHYTNFTAASVFDLREVREIWQFRVTREALPHGFLMHAILAAAAAHIVCISPDGAPSFRDSASKHRNIALRSAVPALAEVTPSNCHAVYAFTSLIVLSVLAHPLSIDGNSVQSPIHDLLDAFSVLRGVHTLLRLESVLEWVSKGALGPLIEWRRKWFKKWVEAEGLSIFQDLEVKFDLLGYLNKQTSSSSTELEYYALSIQMLRIAFGVLSRGFVDKAYNDTTAVLAWGAVVPDGFLLALKARRPMALIILAYYGVLLHRVRHRWWSQRRGSELVRAIYQELTPEWRPSIQWTLEATVQHGM